MEQEQAGYRIPAIAGDAGDDKALDSSRVAWGCCDPADLAAQVAGRIEAGARFAGMVGEIVGKERLLHALIANDTTARRESGEYAVLTCRLPSPPTYPSLIGASPAAAVFERELRDRFGFISLGYEIAPLLFEESLTGEELLHVKTGEMPDAAPGVLRNRGPLVDAPGAFQFSVGPVRSGVTETQQFVFETVGEEMLHLTVQLYYKYRGIETACEGRSPESALPLVERISGRSSFAHSLAFCQAVEHIRQEQIPQRALYLRSFYAELERLYSHFHDLSDLCTNTSLQVLEAQWAWLKEQMLVLNTQIGAPRYLRDINTIGGVRRDLSGSSYRVLEEMLPRLERQYHDCAELSNRTYSHVQRLEATGVLSDQAVRDYACVGPVARACGLKHDARRDHPYAAYGDIDWRVAGYTGGDALARMQVRLQEIKQSFAIVRNCTAWLERHPGPIMRESAGSSLAYGSDPALGWAETPRGEALHFVRLSENGNVARVKFRSPSLINWQPFPLTIEGIMMPDFAVNKASWNLSVAGNDL